MSSAGVAKQCTLCKSDKQLFSCNKCHLFSYCSASCQKKDSKLHIKECKLLCFHAKKLKFVGTKGVLGTTDKSDNNNDKSSKKKISIKRKNNDDDDNDDNDDNNNNNNDNDDDVDDKVVIIKDDNDSSPSQQPPAVVSAPKKKRANKNTVVPGTKGYFFNDLLDISPIVVNGSNNVRQFKALDIFYPYTSADVGPATTIEKSVFHFFIRLKFESINDPEYAKMLFGLRNFNELLLRASMEQYIQNRVEREAQRPFMPRVIELSTMKRLINAAIELNWNDGKQIEAMRKAIDERSKLYGVNFNSVLLTTGNEELHLLVKSTGKSQSKKTHFNELLFGRNPYTGDGDDWYGKLLIDHRNILLQKQRENDESKLKLNPFKVYKSYQFLDVKRTDAELDVVVGRGPYILIFYIKRVDTVSGGDYNSYYYEVETIDDGVDFTLRDVIAIAKRQKPNFTNKKQDFFIVNEVNYFKSIASLKNEDTSDKLLKSMYRNLQEIVRGDAFDDEEKKAHKIEQLPQKSVILFKLGGFIETEN